MIFVIYKDIKYYNNLLINLKSINNNNLNYINNYQYLINL